MTLHYVEHDDLVVDQCRQARRMACLIAQSHHVGARNREHIEAFSEPLAENE